jgi:hypothetical protein
VTVTQRDQITVLISVADDARNDGVVFKDAPSPYEFTLPDEVLHDCPVSVVPAEALQALLKLSRSFAIYEQRFGQVSERDKADILALFSLIEEERNWNPAKRQEFEKWTLAKRRAERKEAPVKLSPEEAERMARYLANHDKACLEKRGCLHTMGGLHAITDRLSGWATLRVWRNKRTDTLSLGILAEDFVGALHVLLLLNLANSESLAVCAWCNKRYTRTMTSQNFCSKRCGNNARKARERSRKKRPRRGRKTR